VDSSDGLERRFLLIDHLEMSLATKSRFDFESLSPYVIGDVRMCYRLKNLVGYEALQLMS